MTPQTLSDFIPLVSQSLMQPRVTLRKILTVPADRSDVITAAWLVIVLGLLLSQGLSLLIGAAPEDQPEQSLFLPALILSTISMFGGGYVLQRVGIQFDGNTRFEDCLKTVVWVNFVILFLQIPIPFAAAHSDEVFSLITALVMVISMVQLAAMVMELHGFTKVFPVVLGIFGVQFLFGLIAMILFQIMGISIFPTEPVS